MRSKFNFGRNLFSTTAEHKRYLSLDLKRNFLYFQILSLRVNSIDLFGPNWLLNPFAACINANFIKAIEISIMYCITKIKPQLIMILFLVFYFLKIKLINNTSAYMFLALFPTCSKHSKNQAKIWRKKKSSF